jgi:hypothetical protein
VVAGFAVTVVNTRPDIRTPDVLDRLKTAIDLLEGHVPHHVRRMHRDFSGFLVERRAYRGAYLPQTRTCLVELTFVVNRAFTPAQVAATILHEAMHARLHARGIAINDGPRQERFCRQAEIDFGRMIEGGNAIVERALAALDLDDRGIAPAIDPAKAAARIVIEDRAAGHS